MKGADKQKKMHEEAGPEDAEREAGGEARGEVREELVVFDLGLPGAAMLTPPAGMLFDASGMRRLAALVVGSTLAAGLAAWAAAATGSPTSSGELEAGSATLPPLPADIKARGRFTIAVKCDSPPFGSIVKGRKVGVDVDIAHQLALLAFGKKNRVTLTCVTTPEREAALTAGRVDLVIATFSYTPDRDTRIDFSRAYYKATGRLLVSRGSPVRRSRTSAASAWPRRAGRSTTVGSRSASRRRHASRPTRSPAR